jgi:hypothetical protein
MSLDEIEKLALSLKPCGSYPKSTKFGGRVHENEAAKRMLASFVVLEYLQPGMDIFIADGSSAFWVALAIFERELDVRVYTNNAAIGMESIMWKGPRRNPEPKPCCATVYGAEGEYDGNYAGVFGPSACSFARRMARATQLSLLPITGLNHMKGPSAGKAEARKIKQAVLEHGKHVVLIADSTKIARADDREKTWVYPGMARSEWEAILKTGKLAVVCDLPGDLTFKPVGGSPVAAPPNASVIRLEQSPASFWEDLPTDIKLRPFVQQMQAFAKDHKCEVSLVPITKKIKDAVADQKVLTL